MKKLFPFLMSAALLGLASCSSTKNVFQDYATLRLGKPPIVIKPIVADMEVGSKIMFTKTYENQTVQLAKESALAEFCKDNKCDMVVNPKFHVEFEQKGKATEGTVTINLSGFPGTYKNIHSYRPEDSSSFNNNVLRWITPEYDHTNTQPTEAVKPKKKHIGAILGTTIGVGLLLLLLL